MVKPIEGSLTHPTGARGLRCSDNGDGDAASGTGTGDKSTSLQVLDDDQNCGRAADSGGDNRHTIVEDVRQKREKYE
jgi:hypothetical protein